MAGIQILVVDDDVMHSKLVTFLLEEAGHTLEVADSAEKALEVLGGFFPGLILIDLQLPGMDGLELARLLRLKPAHRTTPLVALTAFSDQADLAMAREAGCNGTIAKPIDTAAFARQVRNYVGVTTGAEVDVPTDSGDLLAEIRNTFLAAGLEQCGIISKGLQASPGSSLEGAKRFLRRWTSVGEPLGFADIALQAWRIQALLNSTSMEYAEVATGIESARRRFFAAARMEPELPKDVTNGLQNVRIGLVDISEPEANRIRKAAKRANIQAVTIEPTKGESVASQTAYDVLVVKSTLLSGTLPDAGRSGLFQRCLLAHDRRWNRFPSSRCALMIF
jgi:two-component system, cell cycle response regulator DivK